MKMAHKVRRRVDVGPQKGPQHAFLATDADIALYGGAAGGGKSYALLLEPLRHWSNPRFGAVIFRRSTVQVRNEGGLWDESVSLYGPIRAHPRESVLEWIFPYGWKLKFAHLEHESTVFEWQGAQIPFIGFDELTHFSEKQFFYMLSRNRSMSGVKGYVRATCNPDADSWVRKLVDWYIGPDGFPIKERSGVLRWFIRQNETLVWADTREELIAKYGADEVPKSFTFISANITDNRALMEKDPSYLANLRALSRVDRERLLGGNWNIRPSAGNFFRREWFNVIDAVPADVIARIRYWDRAATRPSETNKDPDWTRGVLLYRRANGRFLVADLRSVRGSPHEVESLVKNTASHDSIKVPVGLEQDPGSAGVSDIANMTRLLAGYALRIRKPTKDKETRAKPFSAQCEAGNVDVLRGPWNDEFFSELENFPEGAHDDIVDAASGGFSELCDNALSTFDVM